MIKKWKKNTLLKAFNGLPLWGKIAVPLAGFLVLSFAYTMIKNILWVGLIGIILYLLASAYFYIKDSGK